MRTDKKQFKWTPEKACQSPLLPNIGFLKKTLKEPEGKIIY